MRVDRQLRARGFPLRVSYGPERAPRTTTSKPGIVMTRDTELGDNIGPPVGTKSNPDARYSRALACVVKIYAQSGKSGAAYQDHEAEAGRISDGVITAIDDVVKAGGLIVQFTEHRVMGEKDFEGCEAWPGVAILLRFELVEHVLKLKYNGDARPEGEPIADVHAPVVESPDLPDFDPTHGA